MKWDFKDHGLALQMTCLPRAAMEEVVQVFHVQPNEPLREEIEDNRQQPRDLKGPGKPDPLGSASLLTSALLTASGSFLPSVPRPARTLSPQETCRLAASLFPVRFPGNSTHRGCGLPVHVLTTCASCAKPPLAWRPAHWSNPRN